jgi:hypothetical protein
MPGVAEPGELPHEWSAHTAGDLGVAFQQTAGGIFLRSLYDLKRERELLAQHAAPLFTLGLHNGEHEVLLSADTGWQQTQIQSQRRGFSLEWRQPLEPSLGALTVRATVITDARAHALRWMLSVDNAGSPFSVWRVVFPQVALGRFDETPVLLVPSGPGELKRGAWDAAFEYARPYGEAWCAMQFMAAYAESAEPTGLYLGVHDPLGSTKDMSARSDPAAQAVTLAYDIAAPDLLRPGNGYMFSGEAVWRLLRGDWYDAALIYRDWATQHAQWRPAPGPAGRADTPAWLLDLGAWLQMNFEGEASVAQAQHFREWLGLPVAIHWYHWHQIPFDNDYPHYFPTKAGFAEAVRALQPAGIYSMPYINGRLWDTHDRGTEDFEFTRVALPATAKDEHGQPYVESYGSIEADGSPVRLAVMCPATPLWQARVHDLVMRLINEVGVDGVYIDQVAAMKPVLCMDAAHGHAPGGGHWWNEGYWRLLNQLQAKLPAGRMLTTECNAEGFIPQFDAYLTWHWQHDDMAPAFPVVYGGAIQTFGRAYAGDALAKRMKAAQQLVFGEQIGWFNPSMIDDPEMAAYLRRLLHLRWRLRGYFTAGDARCLRPPTLSGDIPRLRADWQWYGECWVSHPAIYTGAWARPDAGCAVLLFVNASDAPVTAQFALNARDYGFDATGAALHCTVYYGSSEPVQTITLKRRSRHTLTLDARQALAWEITV